MATWFEALDGSLVNERNVTHLALSQGGDGVWRVIAQPVSKTLGEFSAESDARASMDGLVRATKAMEG